MALRDMQIGLAIALLTSMWAAAMAQSGCTSTLITLSPCLSFITGNDSTPSSSCCTQLASVVQGQPQCLCQVLNGGASSLGININQTQALALPGACKVQTPPASRCNAAGGATPPSQTPATPTTPGTPSDSTPSAPTSPATKSPTPAVSTVPSGSGSKSTGSDSSDAKSITVSLSLISSLLIVSAYAF